MMKVRGVRTYKDLAKLADINISSLSSSLHGNPQLSTLERIAEALQCDVADLLVSERKNIAYCPHCGGIIYLRGEKNG